MALLEVFKAGEARGTPLVESMRAEGFDVSRFNAVWQPNEALEPLYDMTQGAPERIRFDGLLVERRYVDVRARLEAFGDSVHWLPPTRQAALDRYPADGAVYVPADPIPFLARVGQDHLVYREVQSGLGRLAGVELSTGRDARGASADIAPKGLPGRGVPLAFVGEGINQVLPVLTLAAMARRGQLGVATLIAIEQPELHLHPAAELALVDVLLEASEGDARFVLETHSETLLAPPHWLPLPDTLQTVALLKFQRGLTGPEADEWVGRADALATRFRAYKVPVVVLASDDLEFATTTFRRVNSTATPMSDLDMVSALVWSPTFDLEKLLRQERESIEPAVWQIDDETWLRCIKAMLGLDLYADTGKVQSALIADPGVVPCSRETIHRVAEFLRAECHIEAPTLVPYRQQIPLLAQAFAGSLQPDATVRQRLAAWFWLTTYASLFSGISGGSLSRVQSSMEDLVRGGLLHWPVRKPFKREPLPKRFDFRHARARALATALARGHQKGPFDLGLYGAQAMIQLVTTGKSRESPGNRFFAPDCTRATLALHLLQSADARALHHVSEAAWSAFETNDHEEFVRLRTQDLDAMEDRLVEAWAKHLVPQGKAPNMIAPRSAQMVAGSDALDADLGTTDPSMRG